jgi:predicted RNA-binding Zn-ribbon protein involved in translation (DUF1610 family)
MSKKTSPFTGLRCPLCGEPETIAVMVETLQVQCTSCGEDITPEQIAAQVEQWQLLARWVASAREPRQ